MNDIAKEPSPTLGWTLRDYLEELIKIDWQLSHRTDWNRDKVFNHCCMMALYATGRIDSTTKGKTVEKRTRALQQMTILGSLWEVHESSYFHYAIRGVTTRPTERHWCDYHLPEFVRDAAECAEEILLEMARKYELSGNVITKLVKE